MESDTDLPPVAEIAAEIEVAFHLPIAKIRDLTVIRVDRQIARLDARARRDEPGAVGIERLIELADDLGVAADLHIGQQFRAELVDFGQYEARRRVVAAVALKIILEIQTEAQVIRAPGFAPRPQFQAAFIIGGVAGRRGSARTGSRPRSGSGIVCRGRAGSGRSAGSDGVRAGGRVSGLFDQGVVEGLEISQAVQLRDAPAHLIEIQRLSHQRLHLRHDGLLVALGLFVDADELDRRQAGLTRRAACQVLSIGGIADAVGRELGHGIARRGRAAGDDVGGDGEVRRGRRP